MKNFKYIIITAFLFLFITGCEESILDKEPNDIIVGSSVWTEKSLVDSYIANLYFDTDFMVRCGETAITHQACAQSVSACLIASMGGEGRTYGAHHNSYKCSTRPITAEGVGSQIDYWKYNNIRNCNILIENLLNESPFEQGFIDQRVAEARFLRAYMYFQMVIRFGGVPLITEAQKADVPLEELQVSRASEKEVYDFIISEMGELINILPSEYGSEDRGRPTKWAAYALQSRAALYAASIAKYGEVQLDGLLGFPASDVTTYAQISYDASKAIIGDGIHSLYEEYDDPAENFDNLFLDESDANKEVIMCEVYDYGLNRGHAYASRATPHEYNDSWGTMYYLYDWIERFEFANGSPGDYISREQIESQEWDIKDICGNRDPRFKASVFYPESSWQDGKVYFHSGTLRNGELLTSGSSEDGWPYQAHPRNITKTGFMVRKRTNPDVHPTGFGLANDVTDYIIFRLGEIYLNLAEAAFYLNKTSEALTALNRVRERACMPPKTELTEDIIHNERLVELTWENQSYWDERRWRIAEELLDGVRKVGIKWIYNYDTKKYQIIFRNAESVPRIFESHYYYFPLGINHIIENPNIIENPGY